jgi:copper chaperone
MSNENDTTLEVEGMSCPSCIRHVTAALSDIDGVDKVDVKLRDGLVIVKHDKAQAPIAELIGALGEAGYVSRAAASGDLDGAQSKHH